jgi:FkbM family methyltransferase
MRNYEKFLRTSADKLLPYVPPKWAHWLRDRLVLKQVLDKLLINCVLDVGANHGQYGMRLRRMGYRGYIVSFEPVRENYDVLKVVASQREPWRVFPYALGAENERREINIAAESVFSSFLTPTEESQVRFCGNRVIRKEEVDVWRLDRVLETCLKDISSPRIYLKLDTQGFDLSVLQGAQSTLPRILALQTELSLHNIYHGMHGFADSVAAFETKGFEVIDFITVNRDIDQLCALEMDCIMTRKPAWGHPPDVSSLQKSL